MTHWWRARRLRLQLTLWHLVVMVVVLCVYGAVVYAFASRNFFNTLDQQLRGDFQWAAAVVGPQPDGSFQCPLCEELESDALTIAFDSAPGLVGGPWVQVWSPTGELLYQTAEARRVPIDASRDLVVGSTMGDDIASLAAGQGTMRIMSRNGQYESGGGGTVPAVIQVARSEVETALALRDLMLILIFGLPLSVAIAGFGGYTLARQALATVHEITARARTITADRLHDRLPIANPDDEMGQLALVFNDTLGRLEASFEQMRRFTADVSHELRTPLTAIQSVGEVGLREPRDGPGYRAIIGSMLEEVDRLARLVGRLLMLSRADTEAGQAEHEPVNLLALAREVVAHLEVLAEEKQETITVESGPALKVLGERLVLRQALINLVHNAIKFTPDGGRVVIRVAQLGELVVMDVTDSGPGIPSEAQARLFDRFYRGAQDAESGPDGTGLGLSIARRAVEANHGHLVLERTGPTGTTFRISMPIYKKLTRVAS